MGKWMAACVFVLTAAAMANAEPQDTPVQPGPSEANPLLHVPVTNLYPGTTPPAPSPNNPAAGDPRSVERGMRNYTAFNCVGCHAPNGGGGMGPSLSDSKWIYGNAPAQIFLSIYQGRPKGMPAWGRSIPESAIWDLVSYIGSISESPTGKFGRTVSRTPPSPAKQQVPAEYLQTSTPWNATEPFTNGRKPDEK